MPNCCKLERSRWATSKFAAREGLAKAEKKGLITGLDVTHTGDDLCLLVVHKKGSEAGMDDS